jgi:hypothetical protein
VASGEQQRSIAVGKKEVTAVSFLPPGDEVAAATGEPAVRLYNAASGATVRTFEAPGDFVQALALAKPYLAAGTQDDLAEFGNVILRRSVPTEEAVQAQITAPYEDVAVGVKVTNQSSKAVKVKFVHEKLHAEGVVAPNSMVVVPAVATGTEDSLVSVKVGKLAARKFKISGNEVRKLYERSGFSPDETYLVIDVRVNKYGVVELRRLYLRKQNPA